VYIISSAGGEFSGVTAGCGLGVCGTLGTTALAFGGQSPGTPTAATEEFNGGGAGTKIITTT